MVHFINKFVCFKSNTIVLFLTEFVSQMGLKIKVALWIKNDAE